MPKPETWGKEKSKSNILTIHLLFIIIFPGGFWAGHAYTVPVPTHAAGEVWGFSAHYLRTAGCELSLIGLGGMFYCGTEGLSSVEHSLSGLAYMASPGALYVSRSGKGARADANAPTDRSRCDVRRTDWLSSHPSLQRLPVIIFIWRRSSVAYSQAARIRPRCTAKVGILRSCCRSLLSVAVNNLSTAIIILGIAVCLLLCGKPKIWAVSCNGRSGNRCWCRFYHGRKLSCRAS